MIPSVRVNALPTTGIQCPNCTTVCQNRRQPEWLRYEMELLLTLLTLCGGNPRPTDGHPSQSKAESAPTSWQNSVILSFVVICSLYVLNKTSIDLNFHFALLIFMTSLHYVVMDGNHILDALESSCYYNLSLTSIISVFQHSISHGFTMHIANILIMCRLR